MFPVIFWGGTGHAKVLREALWGTDATLIALFDNRSIPSPFDDLPIFHGEAGFVAWDRERGGNGPVRACVAIGGTHGRDRLARLRWLEARGYPPMTIVHRRAFVAENAHIGKGSQVMALSAICVSVKLGKGVIVNTNASIDHDCVIGDGVHIAPGATLAGEVVVDDFAFVGTGAVVLPRIHIGVGAIIGAGAVVTRDVIVGETVVGNPSRTYRQKTP